MIPYTCFCLILAFYYRKFYSITSKSTIGRMYLATAFALGLAAIDINNTLLVFTCAYWLVRWIFFPEETGRNYPPGPPCPMLRFGGHIDTLRSDYHIGLTELAREYGPIYQLYFGPKRVIIISDYNLVREAFRQPVFSGRPDTELTKLLEGFGVINAIGLRWKDQRAFLHNVLRDFGARNGGDPNSSLVQNIKVQVDGFCAYLYSTECESVNVRTQLARSISNVIGSMLMSTTYDDNDPNFDRLLTLIDEGFSLLLSGTYTNIYSFLKFVPWFSRSYWQIKKNHTETTKYFNAIARQHKETLDENNVRDIVDAFLVQQKKYEAQGKESFFTDRQLAQVMADLFSAGLETITSTLEWAIAFLVRNPEVQQKVYEEIERVIGTERHPEYSDLQNMPYFEATILEVQRRGNVIALGNTHAALADATLNGYFIPKNTHIMPNLWAIHMDPELWDEPEAFRPERFIVDNKVVKPPYFMPFSVGRRMCVGDTLSRLEMFHFLANIIQKFELRVPENGLPPTLSAISHISLKPSPYQVSAVPRNQVS